MLLPEDAPTPDTTQLGMSPNDVKYAKRRAYRLILQANPDKVGRGFNLISADPQFDKWVLEFLMPRIEHMMSDALAHAPRSSRFDRVPRNRRAMASSDKVKDAQRALEAALEKAFAHQLTTQELLASAVKTSSDNASSAVRVMYAPSYGMAGRLLNEQTLANSTAGVDAVLTSWAAVPYEKAARNLFDPVLMLATLDRCTMGRNHTGRAYANNVVARAMAAEMSAMFPVPRGAATALDPVVRGLYTKYILGPGNAPIVVARTVKGGMADRAATSKMYSACRAQLSERAKKFIAVVRHVLEQEFPESTAQ